MIKIFIGSDRVGYDLKVWLVEKLTERDYEIIDMGPAEAKSVHYPMIGMSVARNVAESSDGVGILVCSTGLGMSIAANKIKGVRAANCNSTYLSEQSRLHNNANVLCLGSSVTTRADALRMVEVFILTPFEGGKHALRVKMLDEEAPDE